MVSELKQQCEDVLSSGAAVGQPGRVGVQQRLPHRGRASASCAGAVCKHFPTRWSLAWTSRRTRARNFFFFETFSPAKVVFSCIPRAYISQGLQKQIYSGDEISLLIMSTRVLDILKVLRKDNNKKHLAGQKNKKNKQLLLKNVLL